MRAPRLTALATYVACVTLTGLALFAVLVPPALDAMAYHQGVALLWVLAVLTVIGELFPLRLRFRRNEMAATTSTTFAFAILLTAGLPAAALVLNVASVISDARQRMPVWKSAFNVAQYTLALGACAVVAAQLSPRGPALLADTHIITLAELLPLTAAGATLLAANYVLITVAIALFQRRPLLGMLRRDLLQHPPMTFVLLLFAPFLVVIGQHGIVLVPLLLLLVIALYRSSEMSMAGEHAALHDPLTDLANRRLLQRRLDEALESRTAGQVVAAAREAAAAVHRTFADPLSVDGLPITVGGSVGVAVAPQHGETADDLLQAADAAMSTAKRCGVGVVVHDGAGPGATERGRIGRVELASQLEGAIRGGELVVHYQPIADISSGQVDAAEALVRWQHPRYGLIGPDEFIPVAEQSALIGALTLHVLDRALAQCAEWHAAGMPMRIAVNLSAHSLQDLEFPALVARALRTHAVDPRSLKLEITEHTVMADPKAAGRVLGELSAMGVHLAIDDFGTGYSSLARLQELPIDEVKIDKSFVQRLTGHPGDGQALVAAIVMFARQLGLRIVAEGVETAAVWDWLDTHGCTFAQGYYLSRPTEGSAFTAWLQARGRVGEGVEPGPRLRLVPTLGATAGDRPSLAAAVIEVVPAEPVTRDVS